VHPLTLIFGFALALALLAVWHFGRRQIREAGVIVAAVWAVDLSFSMITGDYTNWRFMFAIDVMAAAMILTPPRNPSRCVIGVLYLAQIAFHGVFGWYELRGLEGPSGAYLSGLYVLGLAQVASLFIGAADDWARKRGNRPSVDRRCAVSVAAFAPRDGGA
jgi:hypothetical protein